MGILFDIIIARLQGEPSKGRLPVDRSEASFARSWITKRQASLTRRFYIMGISGHIFSVILLPMFAHPRTLGFYMILHSVLAILLISCLALYKDKPNILDRASLFAIFACVLAYAYVLWFCIVEIKEFRDIFLASAGLITYATFGVQFLPLKREKLALSCAMICGVVIVAAWPMQDGYIWGLIVSVVLSMNVIVRMIYDARSYDEASREYRFRKQVAPAHVIRQASEQDVDIQDVFRPEKKFCVCLSSDWRNYQALSEDLSPEALTCSLNDYYNLCESILNRVIPEGNYYTDWIADELFIVIYAWDEESHQTLVASAMEFSRALILARTAFATIHGLPRAIDIGLSCGEALLGMMGPDAHRKVTALGQVPGRSRRYQTTGKILRAHGGEFDRVIFGADVLQHLQRPADLERFELPQDLQVKDIASKELYFVTPLKTARAA